MSTRERKDEHLDICLNRELGSSVTTGLERFPLRYDALPEVDLADVDLSVDILGKRLSAPILIGAMTGGSPRGGELNRRFARVAARLGLGMMLGSQRVMLESPKTSGTFAVRDHAPDLPLLIGNIGAVQLNYGLRPAQVAALAEAVSADAMAFHLNPLQEAIQPEGDTNFAGLSARLAEAVTALPVPAIVKEVGAGFSRAAADKLAGLGFAGIDAAGVGGTSWARVESYRAAPDDPRAEIGRRLAGFGVPTAESIQNCRAAFPEGLVIGSGGIRTGRDAAVALALGANAVALAHPLLVAASESEAALENTLRGLIEEMRILLFLSGYTGLTGRSERPA